MSENICLKCGRSNSKLDLPVRTSTSGMMCRSCAGLLIDKLQARVRELEADKKRLDWLEEKENSLYTVTHEERKWTTETTPRKETHRVVDGWSLGARYDELPTVREAIDAGMEAAGE